MTKVTTIRRKMSSFSSVQLFHKVETSTKQASCDSKPCGEKMSLQTHDCVVAVGIYDALETFRASDTPEILWNCLDLIFCKLSAATRKGMPKLTPREVDILSWMASGKTNGEIAVILGISNHTVSTYTRRIFLKTNTSDRTSASLAGISNDLLRL